MYSAIAWRYKIILRKEQMIEKISTKKSQPHYIYSVKQPSTEAFWLSTAMFNEYGGRCLIEVEKEKKNSDLQLFVSNAFVFFEQSQ